MQEANKQFLKECALYVRGEVKQIKLRGKQETVKLFAEALSASRKFYVALEEGDFKETVAMLKYKRSASGALRESTGYVWPL